MKKLFISIIILFAILIAFGAWSVYAFRQYPNAIVVTTNKIDEQNQFYVNDELTGDHHGLCIVLKDEAQTKIKLVQREKEQRVILQSSPRFRIGKIEGDDLGLQIIRANADENLRKSFDCDL